MLQVPGTSFMLSEDSGFSEVFRGRRAGISRPKQMEFKFGRYVNANYITRSEGNGPQDHPTDAKDTLRIQDRIVRKNNATQCKKPSSSHNQHEKVNAELRLQPTQQLQPASSVSCGLFQPATPVPCDLFQPATRVCYGNQKFSISASHDKPYKPESKFNLTGKISDLFSQADQHSGGRRKPTAVEKSLHREVQDETFPPKSEPPLSKSENISFYLQGLDRDTGNILICPDKDGILSRDEVQLSPYSPVFEDLDRFMSREYNEGLFNLRSHEE